MTKDQLCIFQGEEGLTADMILFAKTPVQRVGSMKIVYSMKK
jgi:hypothetical protein